MPATQLWLWALPGIPRIKPGDDLASIILRALGDTSLQAHDVLVIASKIVSKAENRFVDLRLIEPSGHALDLASKTGKDPRLVELILRESVEVSRIAPNVLIVRHRLGFTSANAGIDQSNTGDTGTDVALLLPTDPDKSAAQIATSIEQHLGVRPAVVISDTHGRPFRLGNSNVAIGIDGLPPLYDQRGGTDHFGRRLRATVTAFADQVAAAAGLVMGEAAEGQPVILVRGLEWDREKAGLAIEINRPPEMDLYR